MLKRICRTLLFLLFFAAYALTQLDAGETCRLVIFNTTDTHGCIGESGIDAGDFAKVSGEMEKEISELPDGTEYLVIDCGDALQGTLAAYLDKGRSMIECFNAARYDVWVLGNHDFDYGTDVLRERINEFGGSVLSSNVRLDGTDKILPYRTFRKGKLKVAVIGAAPEHLRQWIAPAQLCGVTETELKNAIDEAVKNVMKEHPHVVILAIHAGEFSSARLDKEGKKRSLSAISFRHPEILLVLTGHTHETVGGKSLPPASWMVQAPPLAKGFARTDVIYDFDAKRATSVKSKVVFSSDAEPSEKAEKILASHKKETRAFAKKGVADLPFECKQSCNNASENKIVLETCDAMREETSSDAAFTNALGFVTVEKGPMTEKELFLIVPYENYVTKLYLTKAQFLAVLEEQAKLAKKGDKAAMTFTGADVVFDKKTHKADILFDGKKPSKTSLISVAVGSYAASGGGGRYPVLRKIASDAAKKEELSVTIRDALRKHLSKKYPLRNTTSEKGKDVK